MARNLYSLENLGNLNLVLENRQDTLFWVEIDGMDSLDILKTPDSSLTLLYLILPSSVWLTIGVNLV